jgi:hypothetical protein
MLVCVRYHYQRERNEEPTTAIVKNCPDSCTGIGVALAVRQELRGQSLGDLGPDSRTCAITTAKSTTGTVKSTSEETLGRKDVRERQGRCGRSKEKGCCEMHAG